MNTLLAVETGLNATASAAQLNTASTNIPIIIGNVIGAALGLLGVIFLVLMIYAGFLWMTAGGDAEKVKKAKGIITNAIIGLVIVAAAYAITSFIITNIGTATGTITTP